MPVLTNEQRTIEIEKLADSLSPSAWRLMKNISATINKEVFNHGTSDKNILECLQILVKINKL
ncbi:MAG: hypothetical protein KAJ19_26830 [Gammaproteobacteria bacterium]|nr:hypothetical protein [Gammaproteobacteria bacterium]